METPNWIQIIVEIIFNGIILLIFGKWLDIRMKKSERKEITHAQIVQSFYEELVKLNKALITVNYTVQFYKINDISKVTTLLKDNVLTQWVEIISYYDTYKYDLKEFESHYINIQTAWGEFTQQTTPAMLGEKLQKFKDANQELMTKIRKKY